MDAQEWRVKRVGRSVDGFETYGEWPMAKKERKEKSLKFRAVE